MQLKRSDRPTWEYVVVTLLVVASMWMSVALYAKRDQVFKERLLIQELLTLRNYSTAYILEQRQIPKGTGPARRSLGEGGPKRDPFGNSYRYNSKTGWVSSTSPAYRDW